MRIRSKLLLGLQPAYCTGRLSVYEPETSFSRRFWEVGDAVYPVDARNEDQNIILIKPFAQGLRSNELAGMLVKEGNPTMLEEAFTTLAGYSAPKNAHARPSHHEEPMNVAPGNPAPLRPVTRRPDCPHIKETATEPGETKVAKLEAQARPPP